MSMLRPLALCALIAAGVAYYASLDPEAKTSGAQMLHSMTGKTTVAGPDGRVRVVRPDADGVVRLGEAKPSQPKAAKPARRPSASTVSIPRRNGQFFTRGQVNRGSVEFLVDTGASAVALTYEDARKAGLDLRALEYTIPVSTANGRAYAARVTLDEVRIGGIRVRDVDALVMRDGLHVSLLGMSFLGKLQKVEATPQQLVLRF